MNIEEALKRNANAGPVRRSEVVEVYNVAISMMKAMADGFDLNGITDTAETMRLIAESYEVAQALTKSIEVLD